MVAEKLVTKRECNFDRGDAEKILKEHGFDGLGIALLLDVFPKDWACHRKRYGRSVRCIFHSEEKNSAEFMTEFRKESSKMKKRGFYDFIGVIFPPKLSFSKRKTRAKFTGPVLFIAAHFGQVDFDGVTFQDAYFNGATFGGEAKFSDAVFEGSAWFVGALFRSQALFDDVVFPDWAAFDGCEFQSLAVFNRALFLGKARFDDAVFQGAWFDQASFLRATFLGTTFSGSAYFHNTAFVGAVDFTYVNVGVPKEVQFVGKTTSGPKLDEFWDKLEDFDRSDVRQRWGEGLQQLKKTFANGRACLKMVEFLGTDVKKIRFVNVEWGAITYRMLGLTLKRIAVRDEVCLYEYSAFHVPDYGAVAALYRDLRYCYEHELRYADAGDFYVGEMEMRRLNISTRPKPRLLEKPSDRNAATQLRQVVSTTWRWFRRNCLSPIAWYRNLSLYGESYALASFWIIGAISFFALSRFSFVQNTLVESHDLGNVFVRSALAFFQLRSVDAVDDIERVVGAFLLGMLLITLRRKFERH
jgi:hypothetical protein